MFTGNGFHFEVFGKGCHPFKNKSTTVFAGPRKRVFLNVFSIVSHPYRIVGNKLPRNYWTSSFYIKKKKVCLVMAIVDIRSQEASWS